MTDTFPFAPNWKDSVEVTLSFKTDIFTTRSGKETTRRALRTTPRRSISYNTLTYLDLMRSFGRVMGTKQNKEFLLPDWSAPVVRTLGITAGATTFTTRTLVPIWMVAGTKVFLTDGETQVQATILTASGVTVTLTAPVAAAMSMSTTVRRAALGRLGAISTTASTTNVVTAAIDFDMSPGSYLNGGSTFFPYVVAGKEVFAFPWNWGEVVSSQYNWSVEQVDFGWGAQSNFEIQQFGKVTQQAAVLRTGEEINGLLGFLERQKGQRGEFWMPSGTSDLTLMTDIADGGYALTVTGDDASALFSDVYCGIAVYLRDGRLFFRKIASVVLSSGNSVITVTEPFTAAATPAMVDRICWLRPARLASDDATIEFVTDAVAKWQATTTTITFGSDVQDYAPLDGAALWAMDNLGEATGPWSDMLEFLVNGAYAVGVVNNDDIPLLDDIINSEAWEALNGTGVPPFTGPSEPPVVVVTYDPQFALGLAKLPKKPINAPEPSKMRRRRLLSEYAGTH